MSRPASLVGHAFISYVREDKVRVDRLQVALEAAGVQVWRDTRDLLPGQDWRLRIRQAISDEALAFIVCFSHASVDKERSYQNEELVLAIEQLRLRPPENPWLIPVRFDDCAIPDRDIGGGRTLASIQRADLFGATRAADEAKITKMVQHLLGRSRTPVELPVQNPELFIVPHHGEQIPPVSRKAAVGRRHNPRSAEWFAPLSRVPITSADALTVLAHSGAITAITFSRSGRYLASASEDRTARIWETATGNEVARMTHSSRVLAMALSPDETQMATGTSDNTAWLWSTTAGQLEKQFQYGHTIGTVAFNPQAPQIAIAAGDNVVRLRDTETGREKLRLMCDSKVLAVAFSPDGTWLATADAGQTATLWHTGSGKERKSLRHDGPVRSVAFSPDSTLLTTGSSDGTARIWDLSVRPEAVLRHDGPVRATAFSWNGSQLATASADGTARLWDVPSGDQLSVMRHGDGVEAVAFSKNKTRLVTASRDKTARLWELPAGAELANMQHSGPVRLLACTPSGTRLATADGNQIFLWRT